MPDLPEPVAVVAVVAAVVAWLALGYLAGWLFAARLGKPPGLSFILWGPLPFVAVPLSLVALCGMAALEFASDGVEPFVAWVRGPWIRAHERREAVLRARKEARRKASTP